MCMYTVCSRRALTKHSSGSCVTWYMHVCLFICMCVYTYTCVDIRMYSVRAMPRVSNPLAFVWHNIYACVYIYMHVHICVHIYIHMCIYIHTYVCINSVRAVPRSHPLLGPSLLPLCQGRHLWGGIFNTRIYLHVKICACACACIHVYARVRKYWYISIYMCGVCIHILYCLIQVNVHVIHTIQFVCAVRYRMCQIWIYISYMYAYVRSHSCRALQGGEDS